VGRDGLSNKFVKDALDREQLVLADKAISLNKSNPDAYYARAVLYRKNGQTSEAIKDLERAVELRSRDHFLRLELGYTRYQAGDIKGATVDFEAAVRLAPFYAQPRWYLGNMLLQAGSRDEGFAELRRAVRSDPSYLPDTIQRATEAFAGDASGIVKAVGTDSADTRLALERYFIQNDNLAAAMELFRTGKDMPADDARILLSDLLNAKRFADAYEVWLVVKGIALPPRKQTPTLLDGGFESEIEPEAIGFAWRQIDHGPEKIRALRDSKEYHNGSYSLRVEYDGNSNPATTVVSQLVLVEPNTEYRLDFVAQTKDIVTGGLPLITVTDATDGHLLTRSNALPGGTDHWQNYEVHCRTSSTAEAVIIGIQRAQCSSTPCPAFGRAWFDDFTWQANREQE
jgi:tetratricopeptide (TPR) repeat protein